MITEITAATAVALLGTPARPATRSGTVVVPILAETESYSLVGVRAVTRDPAVVDRYPTTVTVTLAFPAVSRNWMSER